MGGADGGASDGKKKGGENGCASDEKGARRGRLEDEDGSADFPRAAFSGIASDERGSHLVARVGVELGEVRQRDDRGDGDDGHEHGGEHETRSVVRPPSVLREETRVRCGVFSFAAGLIILSRPRLPRARSPRLAGGGGHVERSGISTCARAPASPSVDKPCRAGGNADNAVVAARVLHPTDAREGIKGLFCLRRSFDNTRTSGHLRRSRFRFPR